MSWISRVLDLAKPALGRVHDALEGEVVGALHHDAQKGERIADCHPLPEARTADDADQSRPISMKRSSKERVWKDARTRIAMSFSSWLFSGASTPSISSPTARASWSEFPSGAVPGDLEILRGLSRSVNSVLPKRPWLLRR